MKRYCGLLILIVLMLNCTTINAQQRPRRKPVTESPMPQSSLFPLEAYSDANRLPEIVRPIQNTPAGQVPRVWLGLTTAELRQHLPTLRLISETDERVVYTTNDTVFYECYNNHVVLIRSDVKGSWGYPFEQWFVTLSERVESTAFERAYGIDGHWQYIYGDWLFTIRYDRTTDIYSFRYEYLPLHDRYGELKLTE